MAKQRLSPEEARRILAEENALREKNIELINEELNSLNNIFDLRKRILLNEQLRSQEKDVIKSYHDLEVEAARNNLSIHGNLLNSLRKERDQHKKILRSVENRLKVQKAIAATVSTIGNVLSGSLFNIKDFLMSADASIKSLNLELGLSEVRSSIFRNNLEDAAGFAARLGVNMKELTRSAAVYADETGRATMLTEQSLEAITLIGKGTGLGIEQATRLAGKFELMGFNARSTADYVQGVVDTTERMGVNTTKVLKSVNSQFKNLQRFNFRNGVRGFAEMAAYAEKFKVDMDSALGLTTDARNLENAVELAAQLQVMGGEFAKTDPFETLFLARNDPAAFTKKINEMTKGIATFRRNAEGTFETFISPVDIDRLENVGAALGMQSGELTQQARRMAEIQRMRQQMLTTGLSPAEKSIVEGLAQFDSNTGKFFVQIGSATKDISKVQRTDLKMLDAQKKTLEERAIASQTFDQAFQNTVMELKSAALPLLQGINEILKQVRPFAIQFGEFINGIAKSEKGWLKVGGMLMGGALLWKSVAAPLVSKLTGSLMPNILSSTTTRSAAGGAVGRAGRGGLGGLATGAGVGLAGVGIGGGIALAAKGISSLADSMSKLSPEQAETLKSIVNTIGIVSGIAAAAAAGVLLLGSSATAAAPGLLSLGASVALVGTGIGVASAGIGFMAKGFTDLMQVANPQQILALAGGMTALAGASLAFANPLSMVGLAAMATSVSAMASNADGMEKVGNAFKQINVLLQGSSAQLKEVKETIQSIAATDVGNNSVIGNLASILSKPLKVEFADKEVGFIAKVDVNVDGQKLFNTMNIARKVEIKQLDYQSGKAAPRKT